MSPYGVFGDAAASDTETFPGDPMYEGEPTIGLRGPAHAAPRSIEGMDFMRSSGGIFDPVNEPMQRPLAQGPGTSFLDRFAENLAAGRLTGPNARENDSQTLIHSLLKSTLEGFANQRLKGVEKKQGEQDRMERASAERNARNVRHAEEARMARIDALKSSSRAEKERRQREEGWLVVPSHIARVLGDESLTGKRVSPEKYDGYLKVYRDSLQGDNKITLTGSEAKKLGVPNGQRVTVSELASLRREVTDRNRPRSGDGDGEKPLTRREQLKMLDRLDTADARIAQMNRRLETLRGGNTKDYKVQAAIAKLEGDLADVQGEREAAVKALERSGLTPPAATTTTTPATPEAPGGAPIAEPELRTKLRTGRSATALTIGNAASGAGVRPVGASAAASATGRPLPKVNIGNSAQPKVADLTSNTSPAATLPPILKQAREKVLRGAPDATKADVRAYLAQPGVEASIRANGGDPAMLLASFPD